MVSTLAMICLPQRKDVEAKLQFQKDNEDIDIDVDWRDCPRKANETISPSAPKLYFPP